MMVDADGRTGMAHVWGKRSNWVDYTAELDGESLGVAIFDHPQNPRHPTYWHARDYGLFALNPLARNAFDDQAEESHGSCRRARADVPLARGDPSGRCGSGPRGGPVPGLQVGGTRSRTA